MECRFCDIENKESFRVVRSLSHCVVVLSNPRLMRGHLLVIPKRHVLSLSELNEFEQKELFDTTIEYQQKIVKYLNSGCDIRQHNRPFIPENDLKVDHVHIHLQPRQLNDELYVKSHIHDREIFKPLTETETNEVMALFK